MAAAGAVVVLLLVGVVALGGHRSTARSLPAVAGNETVPASAQTVAVSPTSASAAPVSAASELVGNWSAKLYPCSQPVTISVKDGVLDGDGGQLGSKRPD